MFIKLTIDSEFKQEMHLTPLPEVTHTHTYTHTHHHHIIHNCIEYVIEYTKENNEAVVRIEVVKLSLSSIHF